MFFRPPRKRILSDNSPQEPPKPNGRNRQMHEYARLSSLGFEFSAAVALLGWLGWLLDEWTGLSESFPAFLLLGVFLGLGLGIYRMQLKLSDRSHDDSSSEDPES